MKQIRISDKAHQKIKVFAAEFKMTVVETVDLFTKDWDEFVAKNKKEKK